MPWNEFIGHLRADATTSNDNKAIASLPGSPLSTNIAPSSANGRAVGLNTQPAMCADGPLDSRGGPFDGIVTLNSAQPFSFTDLSSVAASMRSARLSMKSMRLSDWDLYLNTANAPRPCPSFEAESVPPNIIAGGAEIQSCPTCSGGFDVGFVGNNSGTLQFNGITANASGRLNVRIWYANGDAAVRYALMSVNGGPGTPLSFPSTGSFQSVGSIQTTLNFLNPGSNNTLMFSNPIVGDWAPDFDRIEVSCTVPPPATIRPQDLFSWSSPGVRNLTLDGSRYFSIDSGSTDIVGFNQTPPGDFGDWLSEACPQRHPLVQNAFVCRDQFSDISPTSPEGINLDVIGYDLVNAVIATNAATNITSSSATLNGTVDPNAITTTVHFQYGTTSNYGSTTANRTYAGNMTQSVSANITGLSPNTTYHFRLVGTNNGGTRFGSDRTFTTSSVTGPPIVATTAASNVASFSATLNGSVNPHGLTTSVYFQYGTTTSYGLTTAPQSHTGNTSLNISVNIGGLTASTTYHFRIVTTNSAGTRYGSDRTFTTLPPIGFPIVTTKPATNVATFAATLNGLLDPHGLTTNVRFQYGTTTNYGHHTAVQSQTGNTFRNIAANIGGLARNTTYHFRIVATNSVGTRYGSDRTFTTQ